LAFIAFALAVGVDEPNSEPYAAETLFALLSGTCVDTVDGVGIEEEVLVFPLIEGAFAGLSSPPLTEVE
jgi:hypothetical protein